VKRPAQSDMPGGGRSRRQSHANSLIHHLPGGKLAALVDSSPDALSATADLYGLENRYLSLEDA